MSLNHFTDVLEKKWMNIGCENLTVYGDSNQADLKLADGSLAAPSLTFQNENSLGFYREGVQNMSLAVNGANVLDVLGNSVRINRGGTNFLYPFSARLATSQGQNVGNIIASFVSGGERVQITDQNLNIPNTPPAVQFAAGDGGDIKLNGKKAVQLYDNGAGPLTSVIAGTQTVLPANATDGFLYIPVITGPPTGVPTNFLGQCPIMIDTVNQLLYARCNGAWKSVAVA